MPELPEVEVICQSLRPVLINRCVMSFETTLPKMLKEPANDSVYFQKALKDGKIIDIQRRGKFILIMLDNKWVLTIHLRMTGKLLYLLRNEPVAKHSHVIIQLDNGWDLRFDDTRQFGALYLTPIEELIKIPALSHLGIEPLSEVFTVESLKILLRHKTTNIKAFLLNQQYIAGIGNIYADEILFQAGIHPATCVSNIVEENDIQRLWFSIGDRLRQGIKWGGSSIKDYVNAFGQAGSFQTQHKVYARAGKPCIECGTTIEKQKLAGRTTCYCPQCQQKK